MKDRGNVPLTNDELDEYRPGGRNEIMCDLPNRWLATIDKLMDDCVSKLCDRHESTDMVKGGHFCPACLYMEAYRDGVNGRDAMAAMSKAERED